MCRLVVIGLLQVVDFQRYLCNWSELNNFSWLATTDTGCALQPLVLERVPEDTEARQGGPASWIHTKVTLRRCSHKFPKKLNS